jgi:hypothetical protein
MRRRAKIAFLSAPLSAALIALSLKAFFDRGAFADAAEFAVSIVVWWIYAGILAALIALPVFLILKRLRLVRWWTALVTGSLVGGVGSFVVNARTTAEILQVVIAGTVGGLVFWFVASENLRPNKSLERTRGR